MKKRSKFVAGALAVVAAAMAVRKLTQIHPSSVQKLANRALLAVRFFRATKVHGMIHLCEFSFIYRDGDRSPPHQGCRWSVDGG